MTLEEMAAELRNHGWSVDPPWTPENCKHENRNGQGHFGADGTSSMHWHCPKCGKTEDIVTKPQPGESYIRRNYLSFP